MPRPGASKLFGARVRLRLARQNLSGDTALSGRLLPSVSTISDACRCLAADPPVTPTALLCEVFRRDAGTREMLLEELGHRLYQGLERRILLGEFSIAERRRLASLRARAGKLR